MSYDCLENIKFRNYRKSNKVKLHINSLKEVWRPLLSRLIKSEIEV